MNKQELENAYSKLITDGSFDRLSMELKKPNIFKIMGAESQELKHSNFLSWLLDPNETHGFGDLFLSRFLTDILVDERSEVPVIKVSSIDLKHVEVRREWRNIDLLIVTKEFVVSIENKIWAKESNSQLSEYRNTVESNFPDRKKVFVFLTPYGDEASLNDVYINLDYSRVIISLETIIVNRKEELGPSVLLYLEDYLSTLKRTLMGNDKANDWAAELYNNHKDLFDFVWDNKPDFLSDFGKILSDKLAERNWKIGSKNKGYVRFYTPEIHDLILYYKEANGWPDKEGFLFEFDFHTTKKLNFKTVITPPKGYHRYNDKMVEIFKTMDGIQKSVGKLWKCYYLKQISIDIEKAVNDWPDKEAFLDRFIDEVSEIVIKVVDKMNENRTELLTIIKDFQKQS